MKKNKTFDCVQMKWDIQRKLREEFAGVPEAEKERILAERIHNNPILGPFLQRVKESRARSAKR
jgi:hypothetical protein